MPRASMAWNLKRSSTRSRTITLKDFDAFTNRPRFHYRTIPNTDGYAPALDDDARILRTEMIQIVVSRVSRGIGHPLSADLWRLLACTILGPYKYISCGTATRLRVILRVILISCFSVFPLSLSR